MAIRKHVKYRGRYASSTFNKVQQLLAGVNGVLNGGETSTSGPTVTIQPLTFIQNGLIVDSDGTLTATLPGSLQAPYFVAVTSSSSVENLAEIITPTFVKRPQDADANTVLVAEWDGQEWRPLPKLQLEEIVVAEQLKMRELDFEGVANGFDVVDGGATLDVDPGTAIATDGSLVRKTESVSLAKGSADTDGFLRIDEVVLRKPLDSSVRVADIRSLPGPAFDDGGAANADIGALSLGAGGLDETAAKLIQDPSTEDFYFLFLEGTPGPTADLQLRTDSISLTAPTAAVTLVTDLTAFDAVLNPAGSIDLIYVRSTNLYHKRVDTSGATLIAESAIYTGTDIIDNPKVVAIPQAGDYYLHIVFEREISGSQRDIGYVRLSDVAAVETAYQTLATLADILVNPSIAKDDDDTLLFLAFENSGTQRVYLRTYDASTAAALAAPTQLGASLELQNEVWNLNTLSLMASSGATEPKVVRTAFKETYVFWRHLKGVGQYGIAAYSPAFKANVGYKSVMRELATPGELVTGFAVACDELSNAYFTLSEGGNVWKAAGLRMQTAELFGSGLALTPAPTADDHQLIYSSRGFLLHSYNSTGGQQVYIRKTTAAPQQTLRDRSLAPSDVSLARHRVDDNQLSVSGTALEEDDTIRRLYEFHNVYASGGVATWGIAAANTLVLVAALELRFFNRTGVYTVPANGPGGLSIPVNSVCYVQIPDDDSTSNLTLQVREMGSGLLDRHNRNVFPLFWNLGGNLYMRFAPWRADGGGETVIIGEGMSQEALDWLGMPSVNPDASNHAYTSALYINQNDGYNAAIGKLDAAIGAGSIPNGSEPIGAGQDSLVVLFSPPRALNTFKVRATWENTVDTDPQMQPLIVTAKTLSTFTLRWPAPTDSANYKISWSLSD